MLEQCRTCTFNRPLYIGQNRDQRIDEACWYPRDERQPLYETDNGCSGYKGKG